MSSEGLHVPRAKPSEHATTAPERLREHLLRKGSIAGHAEEATA